MHRVLLISLALLLTAGTPALADTHRDAAIELMRVSGTEQIMSQMQLQIESMFLNISSDADYTPAQQEIVTRYRGEVSKILKDEMIWDKIESDIVTLYMQSFTEDELKELIAFYQTPLGQKMITRMPGVMLRSAEVSRQQMRHVIPRVKELGQAMSEELRSAE